MYAQTNYQHTLLLCYHLLHSAAYRRTCLNISLLLGDVRILEHIQLAF